MKISGKIMRLRRVLGPNPSSILDSRNEIFRHGERAILHSRVASKKSMHFGSLLQAESLSDALIQDPRKSSKLIQEGNTTNDAPRKWSSIWCMLKTIQEAKSFWKTTQSFIRRFNNCVEIQFFWIACCEDETWCEFDIDKNTAPLWLPLHQLSSLNPNLGEI